MFINTSQVFSFDRLRSKLKYSNSRSLYNPVRKVSILNYYILILVAIGFVYFDSIFFNNSANGYSPSPRQIMSIEKLLMVSSGAKVGCKPPTIIGISG